MSNRLKIASYFFFFMPLVLIWVLIGQIVQSRMTIGNLVKVTGIVDSAKEVTTRVKKRYWYTLYAQQDMELRIYLKDTSEYFRIMDVYKYSKFRGQIKNGDTAEIYIRPKWLVPLGMGYRNDVFQLNINGQTIFDISQTRKNANGQIIVSLLAIPMFILLGRWASRKAKTA